MATVVLKADPTVFRVSANTPDYPTAEWLINPAGFGSLYGIVDPKYWKLTAGGDDIEEMSQAEKDAVDAAEAAAITAANRAAPVAAVDAVDGDGVRIRALIELFNKRDNYLTNRIVELQEDLQAIKASTGAADNIRAAIRASYLATTTRTKPDAVQEYKDDINAGNQDT